jgi:hypothetical protein
MKVERERANEQVFDRIVGAEPMLVDIAKAVDVLAGMQPNMVLTSGAPLPWSDFVGIQRQAILYGAVHEGLAATPEEAERAIAAGAIRVESTQAFGCAGVHAGIYTASTPVFVVEDRFHGARGYCHLFEGEAARRLGFGFYGEDVAARLRFVDDVVAPTVGEAIRRVGGVALRPIAARALALGDEMHARTVGGTLLITQALLPALLELAREREAEVRQTLDFVRKADHFFYRIWMAAAKSILAGIGRVESSSVVTAMVFNCRDFAIQVSGLGDEWFRGPHQSFDPRFIGGKLVVPNGLFTSGSDCLFSECVGLGAFASAAALTLQGYQGVPPQRMIERNLTMYDITVGEHPEFRIPVLDNRGVPVGIDVFRVLETGTLPVFEGIVVNPEALVVGTAVARPPIECFQAAAAAYERRGPA